MGTFAVIRQSELYASIEEYLPNMVLYADRKLSDIDDAVLQELHLIEIPYGEKVIASQNALKEKHPGLVTIVRMELGPDSSKNVFRLAAEGAGVIHLVADEYGLEKADKPLFISERTKEIHLHLLRRGSATR